MKGILFSLWFAGLMLAGSMAHGQTRLAQTDLYLDAMQSIAEGRQGDASDALIRMIEQEPQHAGAWLDLAIIQCELGRRAEAETLFKTIEERFKPPPAIMEVIAQQRAKGCLGWQAQSRSSVMIGRGIDSNVNQGASNPNFTIGTGDARIELQLLPEFQPQRDQYTVMSADYLRELTPNGGLGFLQFRLQQNDSLTRYNSASLAAGAEQAWRFGSLGVRGTGLLALHMLGGTLYQVQSQLQTRLTPTLKLPDNWQFSMLAGISHVNYPTLSNFNANTMELRTLLSYRTGGMQALASLGYLYDSANSMRPGGDRSGWMSSVQARKQLSSTIIGELGWNYQEWRGKTPYSPGLINEIRNQKTQTLRGALVIPVAERQSVQVELRHVKNDENISIFKYNSRQLQLTWQWQNF